MEWTGPANVVERFGWIRAGMPDEATWIELKWAKPQHRTADRAAARLLALDLEQVAARLRSGSIPGWAVASAATQWWALRKLLLGVNPGHSCGPSCGMEE